MWFFNRQLFYHRAHLFAHDLIKLKIEPASFKYEKTEDNNTNHHHWYLQRRPFWVLHDLRPHPKQLDHVTSSLHLNLAIRLDCSLIFSLEDLALFRLQFCGSKCVLLHCLLSVDFRCSLESSADKSDTSCTISRFAVLCRIGSKVGWVEHIRSITLLLGESGSVKVPIVTPSLAATNWQSQKHVLAVFWKRYLNFVRNDEMYVVKGRFEV